MPPSIQSRIEFQRLHHSVISQYDLTGKKVREYKNLREAAKAVKAQPNYIKLILLGRAFTCQGYHWKLGKGPARINMRPLLEARLEKRRKQICRRVTQFDPDGSKIKTYRSIAEAARAINVDPMGIHSALKSSKHYKCRGFLWGYAER